MSIAADDKTPATDETATDEPATDETVTDAPVEKAAPTAAELADALGAPKSPDEPQAEEPSGTVSAEDLLNEAAAAETGGESASPDADALEDIEDLDDDVPFLQSPYDKPGQWFVVHSYAGYENKVKSNLESRIASMNMEESIYEVVIPMEDVIEINKAGKRVTVQKKVFPGYLLVRCHLDDSSWQVIRNTPGVTGFVSGGTKPAPLSRRDVETFLQVKPEGQAVHAKTRPRLDFELGESVRVREGPFADFSGAIAEIDEDRLKVKVLVNIFGRETPVELEFNQIAKL